MARHGYVPDHLVPSLVRMVGLRNILVHGYEVVDPAVVRQVAEQHLVDVETFVAAVRARIAGNR